MSSDFKTQIQNPDLCIASDFSHRGGPLMIAFSGIAGLLGGTPYEFFQLTSELAVNKIYVRDPRQAWYHAGLPGVAGNIEQTALFLREKIDESGSGKVVVFGNSMGGYAAILFGLLVGADAVHAFSPQTDISNAKFMRTRDKIRVVHDNYSNQYFDLKPLIEQGGGSVELNLYYNSDDKLDSRQCRRVKGLDNVVLRPHKFVGAGHKLVKLLRETGELQAIVLTAVGAVPDEPVSPPTQNPGSLLARLSGLVARGRDKTSPPAG